MTEKFIAHSHGILYTGEGNSYYLLRDTPFDRYPWQNDNQQMWYVVKREWKIDESNDVDNSDYHPVGFAFRMVTTNPTIEFIPEEIEVETIVLGEDETNVTLNYVGLPVTESIFEPDADLLAEYDEYVPDQQID